jgi:hypothetical protein
LVNLSKIIGNRCVVCTHLYSDSADVQMRDPQIVDVKINLCCSNCMQHLPKKDK